MQERPTNPNHLAYLERRRLAVLEKIKRAYGFSNEDLRILPRVQTALEPLFQNVLINDRWQSTRTNALTASGLPDGKAKELDGLAVDIMQRYAQAYTITRRLYDRLDSLVQAQDTNFYRDIETRKQLADIYKNHVFLQCEAALRALGLNSKSAHITNGVLVKQATTAYKLASNEPERDIVLRPEQGSVIDLRGDPLQLEDRLHYIENYWRKRRNELQDRYRDFDRAR